jgi:iron(III) transport system substrate-binding protein
VVLQTDAEANKTVGLVERLRAERANPQADVWWGNEPFHSVALASEGVLSAYESPAAGTIPARFKDAEHRWTGIGLRARVIAVHEGSKSSAIDAVEDLTQAGRVAMARPTAGTTGSHVAAIYVAWGDARADAFFTQLHQNGIKLLGGNGPVAEAVGRGSFDAGLTDNDDVASAEREGGRLRAVLPDQAGMGTLALPTTVGLVSGAKDAGAARLLIDYLLSDEVERQLIDAHFAGWSVRDAQTGNVRWMNVDYAEVARRMPDAIRRATAILEGRE